jgi:alpha-tubulin suppressor-like RCC1 family protein
MPSSHSQPKFHLILRHFNLVPIVKVAAGGTHLAALGGGGEVFTWGKGSVGQLGFGESTTTIKEPRFLESLDNLFQADLMIGDKRFLKSLVCGPTTTAVVDSDGNCYVWGDTQAGTICFYPTTFLPLQGRKVQQIVFSSTHGAALLAFSNDDERHLNERAGGEGK